MTAAGEGQPGLWADVRARLQASGVPDLAVRLPGDDGAGWEGALEVAGATDGAWTLSTRDYGQTWRLLRRSSADEIAVALSAYLLTPLAPASVLSDAQREERLTWAAPHLLDLVNRAGEGLVIDVPPGLLLDRIGALDGYLLYPSGTSFEARSLPVSALSQPVHEFLTTGTVRMRVGVTAPWFGRPGGGLRFEIVEPGVGIRDLVREGGIVRVDKPVRQG